MTTPVTEQAPELIKVPKRLDAEDAQLALTEIKELIKKQEIVEDLVHRQEKGDDRATLVEGLIKKQHEAELEAFLTHLHPADIAFILESLPQDERLFVWNAVNSKLDGDILWKLYFPPHRLHHLRNQTEGQQTVPLRPFECLQ